jgi:hypothetical protein
MQDYANSGEIWFVNQGRPRTDEGDLDIILGRHLNICEGKLSSLFSVRLRITKKGVVKLTFCKNSTSK